MFGLDSMLCLLVIVINHRFDIQQSMKKQSVVAEGTVIEEIWDEKISDQEKDIQDFDFQDQLQLPSKPSQSQTKVVQSEFYDNYQILISKAKNHTIFNKEVLAEEGIFMSQNEQFQEATFIETHVETTSMEVMKFHMVVGKFKVVLEILNVFSLSKLHEITDCKSGTFGRVYQYSFNSEDLAIKCISLEKNQEKTMLDALRQIAFLKIASALKVGPKMKKYFGFDLIKYPKCLQFTMEKCNFQQIIDEKCFEIMTQNLKRLHQFQIVHLDVKPENIAFSPTFKKFIFIDFGLTRVINEIPGQKTITNFYGTPKFCSEEMKKICFQLEKKPIDLYYNDAIGVTLSMELMMTKDNSKHYEEKHQIQETKLQKERSFLLKRHYQIVHLKYIIYKDIFSQHEEFLRTLKENLTKKSDFLEIVSFICTLPQKQSVTEFYYNFFPAEIRNSFEEPSISKIIFSSNSLFSESEKQESGMNKNEFVSFYDRLFGLKIHFFKSQEQNTKNTIVRNLYKTLVNESLVKKKLRQEYHQQFLKLISLKRLHSNLSIADKIELCYVFTIVNDIKIYISAEEKKSQSTILRSYLQKCIEFLLNDCLKDPWTSFKTQIISEIFDNLFILNNVGLEFLKQIFLKINDLSLNERQKHVLFLQLCLSSCWKFYKTQSDIFTNQSREKMPKIQTILDCIWTPTENNLIIWIRKMCSFLLLNSYNQTFLFNTSEIPFPEEESLGAIEKKFQIICSLQETKLFESCIYLIRCIFGRIYKQELTIMSIRKFYEKHFLILSLENIEMIEPSFLILIKLYGSFVDPDLEKGLTKLDEIMGIKEVYFQYFLSKRLYKCKCSSKFSLSTEEIFLDESPYVEEESQEDRIIRKVHYLLQFYLKYHVVKTVNQFTNILQAKILNCHVHQKAKLFISQHKQYFLNQQIKTLSDVIILCHLFQFQCENNIQLYSTYQIQQRFFAPNLYRNYSTDQIHCLKSNRYFLMKKLHMLESFQQYSQIKEIINIPFDQKLNFSKNQHKLGFQVLCYYYYLTALQKLSYQDLWKEQTQDFIVFLVENREDEQLWANFFDNHILIHPLKRAIVYQDEQEKNLQFLITLCTYMSYNKSYQILYSNHMRDVLNYLAKTQLMYHRKSVHGIKMLHMLLLELKKEESRWKYPFLAFITIIILDFYKQNFQSDFINKLGYYCFLAIKNLPASIQRTAKDYYLDIFLNYSHSVQASVMYRKNYIPRIVRRIKREEIATKIEQKLLNLRRNVFSGVLNEDGSKITYIELNSKEYQDK